MSPLLSGWLTNKDIVDSSTVIAGIAAVFALVLSSWLVFRDRLSVRCSAFYRGGNRSKIAKLQILTGRNGAKIRSIRLHEYPSAFDRFFNLKRREISEELATPKFVTDRLYVEPNDARVVLYPLPKKYEGAARAGRLWFHVSTSIGSRRCRISAKERPPLIMAARN